MKTLLLAVICLLHLAASAQEVSKAWVADQRDGSYKNPVLHADYSDPDAIRVGEDFYMTASSFEDVPGLPILHSKDLVNWKLIGHALPRLHPEAHFSRPRHGEGVWAPSIRYHKGEYYIYYPDPDFGIYLVKAKHPAGPWSAPVLVAGGRGLIDPCPLWDDHGKVYLAHAFAGSRAGIKSVIAIKEMNAAGTQVLGAGRIVYDGHELDPTIEGPKLYKRNGYYYIFAPAGGVSTGWQLVLRSKNIWGPYERRNVMDQGTTPINGPHQGAWVTTASGEDWFLHFQDREAYGRIVHLQPMQWKADWPVIGIDPDGDGKGEPVLRHKKPAVGKTYPVVTPPESDAFDGPALGLQWQWMSNPATHWYYLNVEKGALRLYAQPLPDSAKNLWDAGHVLLQKFPADSFTVTTKMTFTRNPKFLDEKAGLTIMGMDYSALAISGSKQGLKLVYLLGKDAGKGGEETVTEITSLKDRTVYLRVTVGQGGICKYSYSTDGKAFIPAGPSFTAAPGRWKGAKVGLFCTRKETTNDAGYADFDYFHVN